MRARSEPADGTEGSNLTDLCHREKAKELHEWMKTLESEKFDHMERLKKQKYEVENSHI